MDEVNASSIALPEARQSLHEILRQGAQTLLAQAIEAEVAVWIEEHRSLTDAQGRRQVVRNGYLPERKIVTGVGEVSVEQPRVHDRRPPDEREPFSSQLLPPYLRKTKSIEDLIPYLYLKGISTGDFQEALSAILGPACPGLSATTITRLKSVWEQEYDHWSVRSLADKEYVYLWADGIHVNIRLEEDRQCILVLMGATKDGRKELIAMTDGHRESAQSWSELLLDVKRRGLVVDPKLAVGYRAKYPKACECLSKDREQLLAFYDFPAEHWKHLRTTNPIESTFATIRLRHRRTKGSGSRIASLTMMFKLAQSASRRWRLLDSRELLPDVIRGTVFKDGLRLDQAAA